MTVRRAHRWSRRKSVIAPLGVMAVTAAFLAVGLPAAQAGTEPVLGQWTVSSVTQWQQTATQPADPDGQDGEDNILNVKKIGGGETKRGGGTNGGRGGKGGGEDNLLRAPGGPGGGG